MKAEEDDAMTVAEALRKKTKSARWAIEHDYEPLTDGYSPHAHREMLQKVIDEMTKNGAKWCLVLKNKWPMVWRIMPLNLKRDTYYTPQRTKAGLRKQYL